MPKAADLLNRTISKLQELSPDQLEAVNTYVEDLMEDDPFRDDVLEILERASAEAVGGRYLTETEIDSMFPRSIK